MRLGILFAVFLGFVFQTQAQAQPMPAPRSVFQPYYGAEFFQRVQVGESNDNLKALIRNVMRSAHIHVDGQPDQIVPNCGGPNCYRHTVIGYDRARVFLMGFYYLVPSANRFGIREVYCDRVYGPDEFGSRRPAPGQIPEDRIINTEHTWPQSRFSNKFDKEEQKSDLHHLFPSDSHMNSVRSSFQFGKVVQDINVSLTCHNSRFGYSSSHTAPVFEPPDHHKGNVARALFYFSIRYQLPIAPEEEFTLRMWNKMDPPDADELHRNDEIMKIQGSRNPFVDYPDLADRIQDF